MFYWIIENVTDPINPLFLTLAPIFLTLDLQGYSTEFKFFETYYFGKSHNLPENPRYWSNKIMKIFNTESTI